jgi:hypothetical protein
MPDPAPIDHAEAERIARGVPKSMGATGDELTTLAAAYLDLHAKAQRFLDSDPLYCEPALDGEEPSEAEVAGKVLARILNKA